MDLIINACLYWKIGKQWYWLQEKYVEEVFFVLKKWLVRTNSSLTLSLIKPELKPHSKIHKIKKVGETSMYVSTLYTKYAVKTMWTRSASHQLMSERRCWNDQLRSGLKPAGRPLCSLHNTLSCSQHSPAQYSANPRPLYSPLCTAQTHCILCVHQLQLSLTLVGASTSWVEASLYTPAPKSSNLPTIAFWEPNLPTKARNCNFRHFRDIICVNGTYQ